MRKYRFVGAVVVPAVFVVGLGTSTGSGAPPTSGEHVRGVTAAFADPADCDDGECDAVTLVAATGTLRVGSQQNRIDGIAIVTPVHLVEVDGTFEPDAEGTQMCTVHVDVTIDPHLRAAAVSTDGTVELGEFVENGADVSCNLDGDGPFVSIAAEVDGDGAIDRASYALHRLDPWFHAGYRGWHLARAGTLDGALVLDGVELEVLPGSTMLNRDSAQNLELERTRPVNPGTDRPLNRNAAVDRTSAVAAGGVDEAFVVARSVESADESYATLEVYGVSEDAFGFGEPTSFEVADDLSSATVVGTVPLLSFETGEVVGEITISATWAGRDAVFPSKERYSEHTASGNLHLASDQRSRDAGITLSLDGGDPLTGENGFLQIEATKIVGPNG